MLRFFRRSPPATAATAPRLAAIDRRILGLETEYAILYDAAPGESSRPDGLTIYTALSGAVLTRVKALAARHRKAGHFLENGGFLHYEGRPDLNAQGLLEYSTPECHTPQELAQYARAGEHLLATAIPEAERTLAAAGYRGTITLGKNARDSFGNTYGSHENYLVSDPIGGALRVIAHGLLSVFLLLAIPVVALAILLLAASVLVYYFVYAAILGIGLGSILLLQINPALHRRAGTVSLKLDRVLEGFEGAVRDPLWRAFGLFFHYLFLPLARMLSGVLRLFLFRPIRRHLPTHLVTRQVFSGAGHVAREPGAAIFSVSEKAAAIRSVARLYWDDARPMIDLKNFVFEGSTAVADEKRLHVMASDSNMSEFAEAMKFGTTSLVLRAIRAGYVPRSLRLRHPVRSLHAIAADATLTARIELVDGRKLTALEIQRELLRCCDRHARESPAVAMADLETLRQWRRLLSDLGEDPARCADRVDWIMKLRLIRGALDGEATLEELAPWREAVLTAERVGVELQGDGRDMDRLRALLPTATFQRLRERLQANGLDPAHLAERAELIYRAKKVDLKYHDITPGRGYHTRVRDAGLTVRLVSDEQVEEAIHQPPLHTRAFVRGAFVKRHYRDPKGRVNWTLGKAGKVKVRFSSPFNDYAP